MSARRRAAGPAADRRRLEDVLRAGLAIDAPLINGAVAQRANPNHVKAMAVLAFNHMWYTIINEHNTARHVKPTYTDVDLARPFVPVVAFFAPLDALRDAGFSTEADIQLTLGPPLSANQPDVAPHRQACNLQFFLAPWLASDRIARDIVVDASLDSESALRYWNETVANLTRALLDAATESMGRTLHRGMRTAADQHEEDVLREMQSRFVSASKTSAAVLGFHVPSAAEPFSWTLTFELQKGVRVIDVDSVLPEAWRCFANEREVIILPGANYRVLTDVKEASTMRSMTIRVAPEGVVVPRPFDAEEDRTSEEEAEFDAEEVALLIPQAEPAELASDGLPEI